MKKKALAGIASLLLATSISVGNVEATSKHYVVKPGDTLWKVANHHKLTVQELKSLNALASDVIKVNQKLVVDKGSGSVKPVKAVSSTNSFKQTVDKPSQPVQTVTPSKRVMDRAVEIALPLQGTPYVWAGVTPKGFDCSGFIYYVYNQAGVKIPRLDTIGMYNRSNFIQTPQPGDLLFFENTYRPGISHIGIYLGGSQFIHAGTKAIEIASVDSPYWSQRFLGYKRFKDIK